MNKISVSVIVPCYNVSDYVERCLKSIINQTLDNIEIIIVNDGSTDNTLAIINDFVQKHKNSNIIIFNKENGGYGSAVNLGISNANGEYIAICEPDDYIDSMFYETLYKVAILENKDVVGYYGYAENREHYSPMLMEGYIPSDFNLSNKERFLSSKTGIWLNIYQKKFIDRYNIRAPETCKVYGDVPFITKIFMMTDNTRYIVGAKYYYTRGRPEQSVANPSRFIDIIESVKDALKFIDTYKDDSVVDQRYLIGFLASHLFGRYNISIELNARDTARTIFNFLNDLLCSRELIVNSNLKNQLQSKSFYVLNIKTEELKYNYTDYFKFPSIHTFALNKISYNEILAFCAFKLLKLQSEGFDKKYYASLEFDLKYIIDLPGHYYGDQIPILLLRFLKTVNPIYISKNHPKLLAYVSIIIKNHTHSELSTISPQLRGDAQDYLEWFYDQTAIYVNTTLSNFSKNIQQYMINSEKCFIEYIKNKTIVVVGNSPVELGKNKGDIIDKFDIVIRFNNFALDRYESDYGSKTDVWAISPAFYGIQSRELKFNYIISCDSSTYIDVLQRGVINEFKLLNIPFFCVPTFEFMKKYQLRTFSLGITVLLYLVKYKNHISSLYCAGFSLKEQEDGVSHYFKGDPSLGKKLPFHRWSEEAEILNELIKNGDVRQC
ncbi:glycosyltransferase family 2 protein [Campylobacter lanienae]|uniref:glycosyltransferase family 2 protein n=1 Tax=Campylobacter lanienae TaxID=75658 RepID=UPI000BB42FA2|nr:glycosyltransferase family 2 protein [Campylobacter lanienae]